MYSLALTNGAMQVYYDKPFMNVESCLAVYILKNDKLYTKQFYDKDADFIYEILTGDKCISELIYNRVNNIGEIK